jgi:hypothetical protein
MDWITQAEEMETQEQNLASAIQVRVRIVRANFIFKYFTLFCRTVPSWSFLKFFSSLVK